MSQTFDLVKFTMKVHYWSVSK